MTKRNKYGATALNMSAAGGHLSCVKLLLRSGCPAEETAPAQYRVCPSAVMTAALHGHNAIIKHLAEAGAKTDKVTNLVILFNLFFKIITPDVPAYEMDTSDVGSC